MAFVYRTIADTILQSDDLPEHGSITFELSDTLQDPGSGEIISTRSVTAELDDTGAFEVQLACNDSPGITPSNTRYRVIENWGERRKYKVQVLVAMSSPVQLADLAPAVSGPAVVTYALQATLEDEVETLQAEIDALGGGGGGADLSDNNPVALGSAAPGVGVEASRDDHVHPTTGLATSAALTTETNSRTSADTTLQTNITAEATTRGSADTTLQTNITNEATARSSADSTEATARAAGDALAAQKANNLSDLANAGTARGNLGLGTAATHAHGDYDAAGAATSAVSAHVAAGDPHPGYLTQGEGDAAYAPISHMPGAPEGGFRGGLLDYDADTGHITNIVQRWPIIGSITNGGDCAFDPAAAYGYGFDASGGDITVALPDVGDNSGVPWLFVLENSGGGTHTVTLNAAGGQNIGHSAGTSYVLTTQGEAVWLFPNITSSNIWEALSFKDVDAAIAAHVAAADPHTQYALESALGTLATQNGTFSGTHSGTSSGTNTGDQTVPSFATPAVVLGTSAAAGTASTVIRSDATIAAFDATVPSTQAYGDAAATGSAAVAARRDHKHGMPAIASDATLTTTDITTNNASTTKHGFVPKLPNDATKFYDGTGGYTVPASSGAPTTTPYVTTATDAGLSAEVAIPGLASSAARSGIMGGGGTAAGGISEEYDSATTGLTWNTTPTVVDSNTTVKSHLYIKHSTNSELIGTRSWAPAGALDVRMHFAVGGDPVSPNPSMGLHIGNSGNTSRVLVQAQAGVTTGRIDVRAFSYAAGSYSALGNAVEMNLNCTYLRVTRDGSNNWVCYMSGDGIMWMAIASFSLTFTVANIGLRLGATTSVYYAISDFLRTDV